MVHSRLTMPNFSIVLPLLEPDKVVMIWNYRPGIRGWELELPAGHIEDGEDPETCARRELEEEAGYLAGSWKKLGWFHPSPGMSDQKCYAFLARDLKKGTVSREPYEFGMKVRTMSLREAYRKLWRGEIIHAPTASVLGIAQPGLLESEKSTVSRRS